MDKQQQLEQLFQLAKEDQTVQSFGQTKERFIESIHTPEVNQFPKKQVFTKKWMIMMTTVGTLALSILFILAASKNETKNPDIEKADRKTPLTNKAQANPKQRTASVSLNHEQQNKPFQEQVSENSEAEPGQNEDFNETNPKIAFQTPQKDHQKVYRPAFEEPYQFPKLTEAEISLTKKKKRSMLKALQKHDKDDYAYIPSGSFDYNGKMVSAQAFYMGTTEVTNFEYRTFLFDLLIQDRKAEFLKAKPDQAQWNSLNNGELSPFSEHYFSHKAYNEFPVVNVSREGAELYCRWLSEELRKFVGEKKEGNYNDVRLPIRAEWVKAASYEGKMLPYPWGGPYLRNSAGLILANYARDTTESTETIFKTSGYDITSPSKSYFPNMYGLYNMSGNVAEMVYEGMNRKDPGTAGGSWKSDKDEVQIYAPDPYSGVIDAKPTIGFRIVSTYLIVNP